MSKSQNQFSTLTNLTLFILNQVVIIYTHVKDIHLIDFEFIIMSFIDLLFNSCKSPLLQQQQRLHLIDCRLVL